MGEGLQNFHAFSGHVTLLPPWCVEKSERSPNTAVQEFIWRFHYVNMIDLTIGHCCLTQSPVPLLPGNPRVELKVPTLQRALVFLATSIHPEAI